MNQVRPAHIQEAERQRGSREQDIAWREATRREDVEWRQQARKDEIERRRAEREQDLAWREAIRREDVEWRQKCREDDLKWRQAEVRRNHRRAALTAAAFLRPGATLDSVLALAAEMENWLKQPARLGVNDQRGVVSHLPFPK